MAVYLGEDIIDIHKGCLQCGMDSAVLQMGMNSISLKKMICEGTPMVARRQPRLGWRYQIGPSIGD